MERFGIFNGKLLTRRSTGYYIISWQTEETSQPELNSDGKFNIDFNEIKQDYKNVNTEDSKMKDKMMFIYQSFEMQQIFHRYGNQLVLLDATYKTTKYTLLLFFLATKYNINLQICTLILLQE